MKLQLLHGEIEQPGSHPAWVCGLKLPDLVKDSQYGVTPCVGVWIETSRSFTWSGHSTVTPCVGVWIETYP